MLGDLVLDTPHAGLGQGAAREVFRVLDGGRAHVRAAGISALFVGASGTGKTVAADPNVIGSSTFTIPDGFGSFTVPSGNPPPLVCTMHPGDSGTVCEAFQYPSCVAGKTASQILADANRVLAGLSPTNTTCNTGDLEKAVDLRLSWLNN